MLMKKVLFDLPIPPIPPEHSRKQKEGMLALAERYDDILAVTVYEFPQKIVKARYFTDGVNSIKLKNGAWETANLSTVLRGYNNFFPVRGTYFDEQSEQIAKEYFTALGLYTSKYGDTIEWCCEWDSRLNSRKRWRIVENDLARQRRHFDALPPRPAGVEKFVDTMMPQYLFYSKIDERGRRRAKCSACGKTYTVGKTVPKHKEACTCRKCGATVTWQKDWLRVTKESSVTVWTVVRKNNDLYYRVTEVLRFFDDSLKKQYRYFDKRRMVDTEESGKRQVYNYGMVNATYEGWHWKRFPFNNEHEYNAWIYAENLPEVFGERFRCVDTRSFATIGHKADLYYLLGAIREKISGEYLAKAGLWRLLQMQRSLSYSIEIPSHLRRLAKKYDVSFYELKQLEKIGPISDDRFEAVRRIRDGVFGSSDMMNELGIDKYIRLFGRWNAMYPKNQFTQIEQWYKDYCNMCGELGVDMSNKSVRYPKDLKEAHDRLAKRISEIRNEQENEHFQARVKELYKGMHEYGDKEYTVVFPQLRTDLIAEGQSLCHCVGGPYYRDEHLKGERMIFFIRAADRPDRPLYTLQAQVHEGKILQLYGYGDKPAPAKVREFCERFLKQLWTGSKRDDLQLTA